MWRFAIEELRSRRLPVEPDLMFATECPILNLVSSQFEVSKHGFSTTIMASFFHADFLYDNLSPVDQLKLHYYVHFGRPRIYSIYDGFTPPHLHVAVPPSPEPSEPLPAPLAPPTAITPPPHKAVRVEHPKRRKTSSKPAKHTELHALSPEAARASSAWADGVHGVEILRKAQEQPLLGT